MLAAVSFDRRRLLLGAGGEIGVAGGDFRPEAVETWLTPHLDLLNHGAQILAHRRHRVQQLSQLVAAVLVCAWRRSPLAMHSAIASVLCMDG